MYRIQATVLCVVCTTLSVILILFIGSTDTVAKDDSYTGIRQVYV